MPKLKNNLKLVQGFTLIELLVVIVILGILATIGLTFFTSAQARGRDAQRKSDLKQLANALELFYSDYGKYPSSSLDGKIEACSYDPVGGTGVTCDWGSGQFYDGKTIYFRTMPADPSGGSYYYAVPDPDTRQKFQLFAHLENTQDLNCINDAEGNPSCKNPDTPRVRCVTGICNFAVTSPNTVPAETPPPTAPWTPE